MNNNVKVARSVHILFICVLPSQLQDLAGELKGQIPRQTLVYSFISSINVMRLKRLLRHTNLIKPNFHFTKESSNSEWNYALEVASTFRYKRMLEKTCPINNNIAREYHLNIVWRLTQSLRTYVKKSTVIASILRFTTAWTGDDYNRLGALTFCFLIFLSDVNII